MDNQNMDRKRGRDDDTSQTSALTGTQFDKMKRMMQERRVSDASRSSPSPAFRPSDTSTLMDEIQGEELFRDDDEDDFDSTGAPGSGDSPEEGVVAVLAKEITNLSLVEREEVFQEIHGVRAVARESPEYMQERLQAMQDALDAIPASRRKAYNMALQMDASYVQDADLRARFLRCEFWDAPKAAWRYTKFFHHKLDIFGKDLLCTTIRQRHLSPIALQALMEGSSQMPTRDSTGRLVTIQFPNLITDPSRPKKANLERIFYLTMVNTESEENQRKGSVIILGPIKQAVWKAVSWKITRLLEALPFRREALHVCFDPSRRKIFAKIAKHATERYLRQRTRLHTGSFIETKRTLASFGIPVEQLPIDDEGNAYLSPAHTQKWEARRRWEEQQDAAGGQLASPSNHSLLPSIGDNHGDSNSSINSFPISIPGDSSHEEKLNPGKQKVPAANLKIEDRSTSSQTSKKGGNKSPENFLDTPMVAFTALTEHDVLLGRGKRLDQHAGNVRFRKWVQERCAQYDSSSQPMKTMVCREIYGLVGAENGRFLQLKNGKFGPDSEWAEVTEEVARTKISNCFRSIRRKVKAVEPAQQEE